MYLNVADQHRIHDPTPEQICAQLHALFKGVDFLVLVADVDQYIQAIPAGQTLHVEWRQERTHQYMIVTVEEAEAAFLAFARWDEKALRSFAWESMNIFGDRPRGWVVAVLVLLVAAVLRIVFGMMW